MSLKRIKKTVLIMSMLASTCLVNAQTDNRLAYQKWAPTPPMGWNSFDCYGSNVVEREVRANADYMASHLKRSGYEYVVIDIRWYDKFHESSHRYNIFDASYRIDSYGRLLPDTVRFPSAAGGKGFKPLADYIHSKGLKFGVHLMRGIPKKAVEENTPIFGTNATAKDVYSKDRCCTWLGDMYTMDYTKRGAQEYYNSVFKLYASWGLDFIKIDDLSFPYCKGEIELIRNAIDKCGRKIVFSASPGPTPLEDAAHVSTHTNMWRVVGDLWDSWFQVKNLFGVCDSWSSYIGKGHFPDADMLLLGRLGIRAEMGEDRQCNLTQGEQRTLMAMMAMARSPLMFGGDMPSMDSFTLSLITNKGLLNINQNSTGNKQLFRKDDIVAWTADDAKTGDKYLAVFNAQDQIPVIESKAIWKSDVLSASQNKLSAKVDINLPKTGKLYLYVSDGGNGNVYDHADWIEPTVYSANGNKKLTELKWKSATAGWGNATVGKSIANTTLNVDGKEYADGIGTHANSLIEYDVPEGYDRFTATIGLDKSCAGHTEGACVQFFIFTEDPAGVKPADMKSVPIDFSQIGLGTGSYYVTDIWTNTNLGKFNGSFTPTINVHDAGLYRISKKQ